MMDFEDEIARLAGDRESGASELLPLAIQILRTAARGGRDVLNRTARQVCAAQPGMALIWGAAALALSRPDAGTALDRFEQQAGRSARAIARILPTLFPAEGGTAARIRLVTYSCSGTVLDALCELARARKVHVSCAEGRPAWEGRRLATRLAAEGVAVDFYTDAGVSVALHSADAVLVGADAISPDWFVNKVGTHQIASAASAVGVPTYVVSGREKFLGGPLAECMTLDDQAASEVWAEAPAGIRVRNPYFERVPLPLAAAFVSDVGVLGVGMVPEVCAAQYGEVSAEVLAILTARS